MSYRIEDMERGIHASLCFVGDDDTEHPIEMWTHSPRYRFREIPYRSSQSYGSDDLGELLMIYRKWRVSPMGGTW